jgi:hypothetical protein
MAARRVSRCPRLVWNGNDRAIEMYVANFSFPGSEPSDSAFAALAASLFACREP